jgi:addiction module RelE/StbE family toxin
MTRIIFTDSYKKKSAKFIRKHPELKELYGKILKLAEVNINHPSLRLHKLKGKLADLSSISINLSYRITIYFLLEKDAIVPIDIGSHDEVY